MERGRGPMNRARIMVFHRIGPWRSLASALAWGARGPEFKSRRPDQIPQRLTDTNPPQTCGLESNWSPNPGLRRLRFTSTPNNGSNSLGLSPPTRTRQTRHVGDKPLIPQGRSMSGSPKKPAINPTFPAKNPTIDRRLGADAIPFSQSSHYSESLARPPLGFENRQIGTERANCSARPPRCIGPRVPPARTDLVAQIVAKSYSRRDRKKILGICNGSIYTSAWP